MATISRLSVSLTARTSGLQRGLKSAQRSVKNFTDRIFSLKSAIVSAIGVGSLGALAKSAVSAFQVQEQAVAKLDASISSMGRTTKDLGLNIKRLASQIQNEGIIGDEALIEGASFLTTYKDITDAMLPRTIRVMADLAAKMGGDTTRAANLLGKASMGLVGSLSIAGISLSDATKESKNFNDILREIEEQVGGTNQALGSTATGGITQFSNAWGDVQEKLGGIIAIGISPFLRQMAQDLGGVDVDVKVLGERFRQWIVDSARGLASLADAFNGIRLVIKVIQLGFQGAGLAITGIVRQVADFLRIISRGALVDETTVGALDMAFEDQMQSVKGLKSEISTLFSDIESRKLSTEITAKIDNFAFESELTLMKQRLGLMNGPNFAPPEPKTDTGPQTVSDPESKVTNGILRDIRRDLQIRGGGFASAAVAG